MSHTKQLIIRHSVGKGSDSTLLPHMTQINRKRGNVFFFFGRANLDLLMLHTIFSFILLFLSLPPSVLRGAATAAAVTASAARCDQSWLAVVYRDMHPINNMNLQAGGGHDIQPLPLTCFHVRSYTHAQAEGSHTHAGLTNSRRCSDRAEMR